MCSKVANKLYESVTIPLKKALGIDEFKSDKGKRSWTRVREELNKILEKLDNTGANASRTGIEKLDAKCALAVSEALKRQMARMAFLSGESLVKNEEEKLNMAVITNLGAESDFAQVDNDCRRLDSPTSLKTISNKHIIQANKMYCKDRWLELSAMEKKTKWQWTRNSPQAKRVKELEKRVL